MRIKSLLFIFPLISLCFLNSIAYVPTVQADPFAIGGIVKGIASLAKIAGNTAKAVRVAKSVAAIAVGGTIGFTGGLLFNDMMADKPSAVSELIDDLGSRDTSEVVDTYITPVDYIENNDSRSLTIEEIDNIFLNTLEIVNLAQKAHNYNIRIKLLDELNKVKEKEQEKLDKQVEKHNQKEK